MECKSAPMVGVEGAAASHTLAEYKVSRRGGQYCCLQQGSSMVASECSRN